MRALPKKQQQDEDELYSLRCPRSAMRTTVLGCRLATWYGLLVAVSGLLTTDWRLRNAVLAGHISMVDQQRSNPVRCCNSAINKQRGAPSAALLLLSTSSSQQTNNVPSKANPSSSTSSNSHPAGASAFEHWFECADGAYMDRRVQHAIFGASGSPLQLRGLSWKQEFQAERIEQYKKQMVATIPASLVLTVPFRNNAHWDRDLALQLWHKCSSCHDDDLRSPNLTGYCQLLMQNTNIDHYDTTSAAGVPPSTAPHCLRHWSEEQKSGLLANEQGRILVELAQQQQVAWRQKYDTWLADETRQSNHPPSWPEFQWAMEAVHSRAFCGVQQGVVPLTTNGGKQQDPSGRTLLSPSILAPVLAAAVACGYTLATQQEPSELVLALLALIAVGPALWSSSRWTTPDNDTTTAVLLPLIDSANHFDSADSRIDYNPLTQQFELWIGHQCLVREESTPQSSSTTTGANDDNELLQTQLFVNYGVKSDREWLLNYGFLPGVSLEGGDNEDDYRRMLAQAFLRRNP